MKHYVRLRPKNLTTSLESLRALAKKTGIRVVCVDVWYAVTELDDANEIREWKAKVCRELGVEEDV